MRSATQVAARPEAPVLLFDGDCNFCLHWIARWKQVTGNTIEYLPHQDSSVAKRFPELGPEVGTAAHLIEREGEVYSGAEAVFRALSRAPDHRWLLKWYQRSPVCASVSEATYGFVSAHRRVLSMLTRLAWGLPPGPSAYVSSRSLFLRALGGIYLVAFISLWVQIIGLIGSNGILPAQLGMASAQRDSEAAHMGLERYHLLPTFCWFNSSDGFLKLQCAAGTTLAVLLIIGVTPAPCLFLLWLIYLSLATVCREFLGFQWDNLLLETGFLAIFFAPLQPLLNSARVAAPSRIVLWLLRWLLFRLLFESGCVKLLSGDTYWRNLSALSFHYETQPLPTWLGWYAHQLPAELQKISTAFMFVIELVLPLLIFMPRRLRQWAGLAFLGLQLLILLTGNYCFFNLLTAVLCVPLFDDAALKKLKLLRRPVDSSAPSDHHPQLFTIKWPRTITLALACAILMLSLIQLSSLFLQRLPWPRPLMAVAQWAAPFRSVNRYGLFAIMTTSRPEIIIEGSNDGVAWLEYEFKYKPGGLKRRPRFVEPHQPRLDWQMWFAALGHYRQNPWFINLSIRLLQGSPAVLALLERNPFPNAPPRYLRATVYDYHFTDTPTRRRTGAWWRRERKTDYLPVISLQEHTKD